jgi:hypothetical protein
MVETRYPRRVLKGYQRRIVNEDGREGVRETIQRLQWKPGTALRNTVTERKSGDWGAEKRRQL